MVEINFSKWGNGSAKGTEINERAERRKKIIVSRSYFARRNRDSLKGIKERNLPEIRSGDGMEGAQAVPETKH